MSITEFCDRHNACDEGRAWALANCTSLEDAWAKLPPNYLIWAATRAGVMTSQELRKFAVWSGRQVQHLMADPRSIAALNVAELHASGQATDQELAAARDAAWAAARAAASEWAAADAASAAASAAALDSAWAATRDSAWAATRAAQAAWLRANAKPNFGGAA